MVDITYINNYCYYYRPLYTRGRERMDVVDVMIMGGSTLLDCLIVMKQ